VGAGLFIDVVCVCVCACVCLCVGGDSEGVECGVCVCGWGMGHIKGNALHEDEMKNKQILISTD